MSVLLNQENTLHWALAFSDFVSCWSSHKCTCSSTVEQLNYSDLQPAVRSTHSFHSTYFLKVIILTKRWARVFCALSVFCIWYLKMPQWCSVSNNAAVLCCSYFGIHLFLDSLSCQESSRFKKVCSFVFWMCLFCVLCEHRLTVFYEKSKLTAILSLNSFAWTKIY